MSLSRFTSPVVRLALSQGLAYAGRGAALTALIWVLYQERGAWWVSASMLAVFGVSTLVSPWAGHAGDRHDRRVVVLVSALAAAAGFAVAAPLAAAGLVIPLVLVTIVAASTQGALAAAVQGAIPALVGEDELARANSLAGACKSAGFMLGPGVGGALLAVTGAPGVFIAAAGLLLGSALLVARLPGSFRALQPEDGPGSSLDGYRRLMADPWLRLLTIAWTLVMAGIGPVIVAEVVLADQFDVGSAGYGLIAVFWDGGGVIGALLGRKISRTAERPAVVGGLIAIGLGFTIVGLTPIFWPVLLGMLVAGLFDAFGVVAAQNIIQRRTPDHLRSRVSAALDAVVLGSMSLSFALGAPMIDLLGAQGVYLAAAVLCLVGALMLVPTLAGVPPLPMAGRGSALVARGRRAMSGPRPHVRPRLRMPRRRRARNRGRS
jgi:MFS family permease